MLETSARTNHLSVSEQVRCYVKKGMSTDAYLRDEEKILANTKERYLESKDSSHLWEAEVWY